MDTPVYILINPNSHQGRAWKRWLSIKNDIAKRLPSHNEIVTEKSSDIDSIIAPLLHKPATIISAGGDGTMHYLANSLLRSPIFDKSKTTLGAIGLGSSNDLLKPFNDSIKSIPVKINTASVPILHDVGKARFTASAKEEKEKYFIINASFGATAYGNWIFNHPGGVLKWLKKKNTGIAIGYTSLSTILGFRNENCTVSFNGNENNVRLSNVNILKIPFVAGDLHYDQHIEPGDGRLGLNMCTDMNKFQLLNTLLGLKKGKFNLNNKRSSTFIKSFQLKSAYPVVFECDGETEKVFDVDISILPGAIKLLGD